MTTLEQIQDLETSRKGYLINPTTNLDYDTSTANSFKGTVLYDDDPNLITFTSTQSGAGYLGKLLLWQLPVGTHYTSPALVAEYIKVLRPLQSIPIHNATITIEGITYTFKNVLSTPAVPNEILISSYSMDKCWKKISFSTGTVGVVEKDDYNSFTVLAATTDNNPQPIPLLPDSVLGRIGDTIQSILIDKDLATGSNDTHDTVASAKAVVDYVNNQIAGALTFNGGYNVAADTTTAENKKLQTSPYPTITKGDTYVITTGGLFFDCPVNNQQVTINGTVYTFKDVLTTPAVDTEILISSYTPINGKTILINSVTYTFITAGTPNSSRILVSTNPVALNIGDMLIANKVDPRVLTDWTLVIKSIPNIVTATEEEAGIIELATQDEVNVGNNANTGEPIEISSDDEAKAVTPKKLAKRLYDLYTFLKTKFTGKTSVNITWNLTGILPENYPTACTIYYTNPSGYSITNAHGINSQNLSVNIQRIDNGEFVEAQVVVNSSKNVIISFSKYPGNDVYRAVIIG